MKYRKSLPFPSLLRLALHSALWSILEGPPWDAEKNVYSVVFEWNILAVSVVSILSIRSLNSVFCCCCCCYCFLFSACLCVSESEILKLFTGILIFNLKLCYRTVVTKMTSYWHKTCHKQQWNRTENLEINKHSCSYLTFDKCSKFIHWIQDSLFANIHSQCINDFNIRPETSK